MTAHLAWKERTFSPVPIDLSKWSGAPARPVDVMELIRSAMDLPAPPVDELAHPDNQSRVLANWLFSKLRNSGTIWILVFDGLDQPTLTPEALRLIETIAEDSVNKPEIPIRVVLLGYAKNLPGNESMALREQINPIGLPEIRKCLEDTAKHLNVQLEAGAIDRVLQRMLAGLAPEQTLPLADVSKAIVVYAQRLFVSNPSG